MKYILFPLTCFLLLTACRSREMNPAEYTSWAQGESSLLHQQKEMGPYQFDLVWQPMQLQLAQAMMDGHIPNEELSDIQAEGARSSHFQMRITPDDQGEPLLQFMAHDDQSYQNAYAYLAYDLQKDLKLVQGADTLRPSLYHFEQGHDLTPHGTLVFAFDLPEDKLSGYKLHYDDKILGIGPLRFGLAQLDQSQLPTLKL
ncbi:MAG: hypothetical protein AAF206_27045 [Bacteroidota bacterium]